MLLEISGEITPERMKRHSQSKNNTQQVMKARSDAVKSILYDSIYEVPGVVRFIGAK